VLRVETPRRFRPAVCRLRLSQSAIHHVT
jgi:hypothetical protein